MPRLTLSFISAFNERVDPLMNGTIKAEGIDIVPTYSHPSETFWRQLKFQEFDIAEMSMSSYLIARARGFDMMALPVFPSRRLFHTELSYHTMSSASDWVSGSTSKRRRYGHAAYSNTSSASHNSKFIGIWSALRS
jgi:4,5-dihydroxyphthalate decarboxylase